MGSGKQMKAQISAKGMQIAGYNAFTLSPKRWAETTSAIGIYSNIEKGQDLETALTGIILSPELLDDINLAGYWFVPQLTHASP